MPDQHQNPQLQNELVRRAIDRDAQQSIEPRHEWTRDVYPKREDPFSSPDLLHQVMSLSGYMPGSDSMSIGEISPLGPLNALEGGVEDAGKLLTYSNEFEPWRGAKNLWEGAKRLVGKAPEMMRMTPDPLPPSMPAAAPRVVNPKPGGALYEVLERAALKSGMGDTPTPGESSLLQQFMPKR